MTGTVSNDRKEPPGNHARYEYEYQYQYIDIDIDIDIDVEANKALLPKNQENYLEEQMIISCLKEQESAEEDGPELIKLSLSYPELFCGVFFVLLGLLHITMCLPTALNGIGLIVEDAGANSHTNFHNSSSNTNIDDDNAKLLEDLKGFVTISIDEAIRNGCGCGGDVEVEVEINDMPLIDDNSDAMQLMMLFGHSF